VELFHLEDFTGHEQSLASLDPLPYQQTLSWIRYLGAVRDKKKPRRSLSTKPCLHMPDLRNYSVETSLPRVDPFLHPQSIIKRMQEVQLTCTHRV
jgi:hypothetical protein